MVVSIAVFVLGESGNARHFQFPCASISKGHDGNMKLESTGIQHANVDIRTLKNALAQDEDFRFFYCGQEIKEHRRYIECNSKHAIIAIPIPNSAPASILHQGSSSLGNLKSSESASAAAAAAGSNDQMSTSISNHTNAAFSERLQGAAYARKRERSEPEGQTRTKKLKTDKIINRSNSDVIDLLSDDEKGDSDNSSVIAKQGPVHQLLAMGFSEADAHSAMKAAQGNVEVAATIILEGRLGNSSVQPSLSLSSSSSSTSLTAKVQRPSTSIPSSNSMFDDFEGTANLRMHIASDIDYDETLAFSLLPRHGFMLESIAQYPDQFLSTLLKYDEGVNFQGGVRSSHVGKVVNQGENHMVVKIRRDEKAMLQRLLEYGETLGLSEKEVSNYWLVCDRNEALTKSLLESL